MKTLSQLRQFLALLFVAASSLAFAANPEKYFERIGENSHYDYSYTSKELLQTMGASPMILFEENQLPIKASDISSIETLTTRNGKGFDDDELWAQIKKLKEDQKLTTLYTKKQQSCRYDILGRQMATNPKCFSQLLIVTQYPSKRVKIIYVTGKIPLISMPQKL